MLGRTPKWLNTLERLRAIRWLGVPNIAILLVTLQVLGFFFIVSDPIWIGRLALLPDGVTHGEVWRLITFLALPIADSPLFLFFALWFLYFIVNAIETEWGSFKTTFYVLISLCITIAYSFIFDYPILSVNHFVSSLFLAAAALFPEFEVRLFFALPVKIKWLAWITIALVIWEMIRSTWIDRFYILAIFSNYLLFFGPAHFDQFRQIVRRWNYRRRSR